MVTAGCFQPDLYKNKEQKKEQDLKNIQSGRKRLG
jgi:hypothetical protein